MSGPATKVGVRLFLSVESRSSAFELSAEAERLRHRQRRASGCRQETSPPLQSESSPVLERNHEGLHHLTRIFRENDARDL